MPEIQEEKKLKLESVKNHYIKCPQCGIIRNIEETLKCPICEEIKERKQIYIKKRANLKKHLQELPSREQKILIMRFGLKNGIIHPLSEVGRKFKLSRQRIHQIEIKVFEKFKTN